MAEAIEHFVEWGVRIREGRVFPLRSEQDARRDAELHFGCDAVAVSRTVIRTEWREADGDG